MTVNAIVILTALSGIVGAGVVVGIILCHTERSSWNILSFPMESLLVLAIVGVQNDKTHYGFSADIPSGDIDIRLY